MYRPAFEWGGYDGRDVWSFVGKEGQRGRDGNVAIERHLDGVETARSWWGRGRDPGRIADYNVGPCRVVCFDRDDGFFVVK